MYYELALPLSDLGTSRFAGKMGIAPVPNVYVGCRPTGAHHHTTLVEPVGRGLTFRPLGRNLNDLYRRYIRQKKEEDVFTYNGHEIMSAIFSGY
jgi:hypothetical protein